MNGEIMELVLTKLNHCFASEKRKVLLLMDNAGCHPEELKGKFSNIKIVSLPVNTTSKLQPLDLGIIQNFKVHYCKMLLQHVIARIDQCNHASEVVKSVNILASIRWIALAWAKVKPETIMKCFRKAGILRDDMSDIVTRMHDSEDPFVEADECMELQHLIDQTLSSEQSCSAAEYLSAEDEVPVCVGSGNDWEREFMEQLGSGSDAQEQEEVDECAQECSETNEEPEPTVQTFREALNALDNVKLSREPWTTSRS